MTELLSDDIILGLAEVSLELSSFRRDMASTVESACVEIERLRANIEDLELDIHIRKGHVERLTEEKQAQADRIEVLEAALREILAYDDMRTAPKVARRALGDDE